MPYIWKKTAHEQPLNKGFIHNGTQYGKNWLVNASAEMKEAIGIEWVDDDRPKLNERYWRIRGRRGDWKIEARDMDELNNTR